MQLETILTELRAKNDLYISNIVQQERLNSKEKVTAAKIIYKERNLDTPQKQDLIQKIPQYNIHAKQMLLEGQQPRVVQEYLMANGLSKEQSADIVKTQYQSLKNGFTKKPDSKGNIIFVIILLLLTFKIFRLIAVYS